MSPPPLPPPPDEPHTGDLDQSMRPPQEEASEQPPTNKEAATNGTNVPPEKAPADIPLLEKSAIDEQFIPPSYPETEPQVPNPPGSYSPFENPETSI